MTPCTYLTRWCHIPKTVLLITTDMRILNLILILPSSGILHRVGKALPSHLLHADILLGWFSTLKIEVIISSETLVHTQTPRRYISDDGNIHNYRRENLKSHISHTEYFSLKGSPIQSVTLQWTSICCAVVSSCYWPWSIVFCLFKVSRICSIHTSMCFVIIILRDYCVGRSAPRSFQYHQGGLSLYPKLFMRFTAYSYQSEGQTLLLTRYATIG
jgi:hypothetical protein